MCKLSKSQKSTMFFLSNLNSLAKQCSKAMLLLTFIIMFSGCAYKAAIEPKVSLYSLEDNNYPCVVVKFPEQIRFERMQRIGTAENTAIVYHLSMPGYSVEVVKLYSKTHNWAIDSLSSLSDDISKVYEMGGDDEFADKSALIKIESYEDSLRLKGSIAEYLQNDLAVRVDITKTVKNATVFRRDAVEKWRASTGGNRSIENMREIVDFIFQNINTVSCSNKDSIDMKWW